MSGWLQYPKAQARPGNFAVGRQGYRDIWFVVHCTDDGYSDTYPTSLGKYWQRALTKVSVHFGVSDTETRQYVSMDDTAFQCRNPGNLRGVGVELSGLSAWTRVQWLAHRPMIRRAATLCAEVIVARGYDRTASRLAPASLRGRQSGLTQHADLTATFGGSHTDAGRHFPWDLFSAELLTALERLKPPGGKVKPPTRPAAAAASGKDALVAVTDAQFNALVAKVNALYGVLVDGKAYGGSSLQGNLGYVVDRINAVGAKVDATDPKAAP